MAPPMDHRLLRPKAAATFRIVTEAGQVLAAEGGQRLRRE